MLEPWSSIAWGAAGVVAGLLIAWLQDRRRRRRALLQLREDLVHRLVSEIAHEVVKSAAGDPVFEAIAPSGDAYRLYLNGCFEGSPSGSVCVNRLTPRVNLTLGLLARAHASGGISEEHRAKILAAWGCTC